MLSDEEKKAIEKIKKILYMFPESEELKLLLNLTEKQSKEIEELKEDNEHQWEERCKLTFELENSTPNDKIKAKIEELNNKLKNADEIEAVFIIKQQQVLQSLLEKE